MRDSFLVTTTGAVEGYRVSTHLGPVIVPMIGAGNFIRDWFARLRISLAAGRSRIRTHTRGFLTTVLRR